MALLAENQDVGVLPAGFALPKQRISRGAKAIIAFAAVGAVLWFILFRLLRKHIMEGLRI